MERDILQELTEIFREVFDDRTLQPGRETTANDVEQWDSLTHIEMIVAVEAHFGIRFKSLDLKKLNTVGDLVDMIKVKMEA